LPYATVATMATNEIESDDPTLEEKLQSAKLAIQRRHATRVSKMGGAVEFRDFWNQVCADMTEPAQGGARRFEYDVCFRVWNKAPARKESKKSAPLGSTKEPLRLPRPEASESLSIAVAYWLEAARYEGNAQDNRAWSALLQCHYWLGCAGGPETMLELASAGGKSQPEAYVQLSQKLVEWLGAYPDRHFPSIAAAIRKVTPQAKDFLSTQGPLFPLKEGHRTREDAIFDWISTHRRKAGCDLQSAFDRVTRTSGKSRRSRA
jgi:hypothetical protein